MKPVVEVRLRPVRRPDLSVLQSGLAAVESCLERARTAATPRERCALELHASVALLKIYRAARLAAGGQA